LATRTAVSGVPEFYTRGGLLIFGTHLGDEDGLLGGHDEASAFLSISRGSIVFSIRAEPWRD
jgi:hypothetical protein